MKSFEDWWKEQEGWLYTDLDSHERTYDYMICAREAWNASRYETMLITKAEFDLAQAEQDRDDRRGL